MDSVSKKWSFLIEFESDGQKWLFWFVSFQNWGKFIVNIALKKTVLKIVKNSALFLLPYYYTFKK